MGVGVNGGIAAQAAAGEVIGSMIENHIVFLSDAMQLIDGSLAANTITAGHAVNVLMNIAAALPLTNNLSTPAYAS